MSVIVSTRTQIANRLRGQISASLKEASQIKRAVEKELREALAAYVEVEPDVRDACIAHGEAGDMSMEPAYIEQLHRVDPIRDRLVEALKNAAGRPSDMLDDDGHELPNECCIFGGRLFYLDRCEGDDRLMSLDVRKALVRWARDAAK